jgi:hypothetical protein
MWSSAPLWNNDRGLSLRQFPIDGRDQTGIAGG